LHSILRLAAAAALLAAAGPALAGPPAYHVEATLPLSDGGWDLASFDPVLGRVYIARSDAVTAIDVRSGTVTAKLAPASGGHAVVPLNQGAEILVTDGHDDMARIYDAKSGARLAEIATGQKPDSAVFDAATGLAVVMNGRSGDLTLVDPATRKAVGQVAIGGGLELASGDGAGRLFVNIEDRNEVAVVDLRARKLVKTIPLTGCEGPTGLAWLPLARRVLSTCVNGVATLTDPDAGKVTGSLPIGQGPDSALYDPERHIAFVPAGRSGELDLFADAADGVKPLGKVATRRGARTGAVDPATGRIYLPAADYLPPAQPGGRPQIKPGSVVAVVVAP
jgi:DNA-binding beta-propeller fold protein YncE